MKLLLHELSPAHPLRNTPLHSLAVTIRNRGAKLIRDPRTWRIGKSTYNELGDIWKESNEFEIETP